MYGISVHSFWTLIDLKLIFVLKVVANLGLCVSVYDIKSIEGGFIFPSDGAATYTVYLIILLRRTVLGIILFVRVLSARSPCVLMLPLFLWVLNLR